MELVKFMVLWLAGAIRAESSILLNIIHVFHVGAQHNPKQSGPRDIVAKFSDLQTRMCV